MLIDRPKPSADQMTRYYFDLRDEDGWSFDEEGIELPSILDAQWEAAKSLADVARDAVRISPQSEGPQSFSVEVRDDAGPVMQVRFCFEVSLKRQQARDGHCPEE